jgi:hypothetical protein
LARLYFINDESVQIDVLSEFYIRDITYPGEFIDMDTAPDTEYFILFWFCSSEYSYQGTAAMCYPDKNS